MSAFAVKTTFDGAPSLLRLGSEGYAFDRADQAGAVYTVRVSRRFVAQHYLTVPDCGPENELHSHRFEVLVELAGSTLSDHDYLVDIDDLSLHVDDLVEAYTDVTLNDQPGFAGHNPSVERFTKVFCDRLLERVETARIEHARVCMREDETARVCYETELSR